MAEAEVLVERLLASQNADGGWPYQPQRGTSWTEPSALAVLAIEAQPQPPPGNALSRGISWLVAQQRHSGGWPPHQTVDESTSVTSLATMALLPYPSQALHDALTCTAGQIYPDDFSFSLLLAKTLHLPPVHAPGSVPWYPGNAGWVMPTCLTVLTLLRGARAENRPELRPLAEQSCSYLLSRRCVDEGWNHGGSNTRSENATSYPETTGMALLALRAASFPLPPASLALAHTFAAAPQSLEGLSWIQMALTTPNHLIADPATLPPARTNRDVALRLLALAARAGRNMFLVA